MKYIYSNLVTSGVGMVAFYNLHDYLYAVFFGVLFGLSIGNFGSKKGWLV